MKGTDGKMSEREKIIAVLKSLGLDIVCKSSSLCYDEVLVYNDTEYLGYITFKDDELVIDLM